MPPSKSTVRLFSCTICDEFTEEDSFSTLCGHIFHFECIFDWLHRSDSNTCPNCRHPVLAEQLVKLNVTDNEKFTIKPKEEIDLLHKELNNVCKCDIILQSNVKELTSKLRNMMDTLRNSQIDVKNIVNELFSNKLKREKELNNKSAEYKFDEEQSNRILLQKQAYFCQARHLAELNKVKSEIHELKLEKARIQNIHHDYQQPSTSSKNAGNKFALPRQIQSPKLQPSADGFLSNCHFWIVDELIKVSGATNHRYFNEHRIMEHGGTVAKCYTNIVTHVIGISQKNVEVLKGLKECKKCVTDYWLSDVIAEKKKIKPWLAHHFPIPYRENNLPYENTQIAIANFNIKEYLKVKTMVEVTGATVVNKISRKTSIVISLKLEGEMIERAVALKIPVVNVQWINDILLGEKISLRHFKRKKYQEFDLPNPYVMNYTKVSHLMEAWNEPKLKSPSKRKNYKSTMINKKMKTSAVQEFSPSGVNNGDGNNITSTTSILAKRIAT